MATNAVAPMSNLIDFLSGLVEREHEIRAIVKETVENGGSSTDLSRLGAPGEAPSTGYMVGGIVKPRVIAFDTFRDLESIATNYVAQFIAENAHRLSNSWGRPTILLGTWVDESTMEVHLDLSEHVVRLDTALKLAEERGELAIWDLSTQESILTEHGKAAAV